MKGKRILIVDDEFSARMLLLTLLRTRGQCDVVMDGEEALKAVAQAFEAGRPYDLICLDIMMAGMDGQTCLRRIRAKEREAGCSLGQGAKIVMTSALSDASNIMTAFREHCDAYLVKPIDQEALDRELEKIGFLAGEEGRASADRCRVLAADDDHTSLLALVATLEAAGYEVASTQSGVEAREILTGPNPPELAVLDWVMPDESGVSICRTLRESLPASFVYRILLTGRTSREDRLEGLASGAHDFLHKPFDGSELIARLKVGEMIVAYERKSAADQLKLEQYAARLESLAEERARQLIHADRLASLGTMAAGVAHEINNPTAMISGNVQMIASWWPLIRSALREWAPPHEKERRQRDFLVEELPQLIAGIEQGVRRVTTIVRNLGKFARQEAGTKKPCRLDECLAQALEMTDGLFQREGIELQVDRPPGQVPLVHASSQEMVQVLINLIHNACQAMRGSETRQLHIVIRPCGQEVVVEVADTGPGLPARLLDNIWKPFFTTKPAGDGTGLGLSICLGIITDHQGTITASNRGTGGALFRFTLPVLQPISQPQKEEP